jgi:hypothetical protein
MKDGRHTIFIVLPESVTYIFHYENRYSDILENSPSFNNAIKTAIPDETPPQRF